MTELLLLQCDRCGVEFKKPMDVESLYLIKLHTEPDKSVVWHVCDSCMTIIRGGK